MATDFQINGPITLKTSQGETHQPCGICGDRIARDVDILAQGVLKSQDFQSFFQAFQSQYQQDNGKEFQGDLTLVLSGNRTSIVYSLSNGSKSTYDNNNLNEFVVQNGANGDNIHLINEKLKKYDIAEMGSDNKLTNEKVISVFKKIILHDGHSAADSRRASRLSQSHRHSSSKQRSRSGFPTPSLSLHTPPRAHSPVKRVDPQAASLSSYRGSRASLQPASAMQFGSPSLKTAHPSASPFTSTNRTLQSPSSSSLLLPHLSRPYYPARRSSRSLQGNPFREQRSRSPTFEANPLHSHAGEQEQVQPNPMRKHASRFAPPGTQEYQPNPALVQRRRSVSGTDDSKEAEG